MPRASRFSGFRGPRAKCSVAGIIETRVSKSERCHPVPGSSSLPGLVVQRCKIMGRGSTVGLSLSPLSVPHYGHMIFRPQGLVRVLNPVTFSCHSLGCLFSVIIFSHPAVSPPSNLRTARVPLFSCGFTPLIPVRPDPSQLLMPVICASASLPHPH